MSAKEKRAREMFEELGYECDVSYDGILYSKYKDLSNGGVAHCYIDFDKTNKIIEKDLIDKINEIIDHLNNK